MIPRMTTVGTLKGYRYNLNRSNNTMSKAMNTVITQRTFNSYAEDPALATRCFQLRRSYWRTASQLTANDSLRHKYDVAWSAKLTASEDIYALADDTAFGSILRSENGATAGGRQALGQSLSAKAKDLVQTMNGRYGENYVFAGADSLNVPFTWEPKENPSYVAAANPVGTNPDHAPAFQYVADPAKVAPGVLYTKDPGEAAIVKQKNPYYDEDFTKAADAANDTEAMKNSKYGEYLLPADANGIQYGTNTEADAADVPQENEAYSENHSFKYLKADGSGTNDKSEAATALYYRGVAVDSNNPNDLEKMESFLKETKYIDIGLGHKEENGEAISSSVFNCALQGIYYTGGSGSTDIEVTLDNGSTRTVKDVPNNLISVIDRLGTILQRCDPDDGSYASPEDEAEAKALAQQFEDHKNIYIQRWAELDTQTGFLRDNGELLTDTADSLSQQFMALEDVNPAAAITSYMFARYSYDTALKVGNSILSQSLMDYLSF